MLALIERYLGYFLSLIFFVVGIYFKWDYSKLNDFKFFFSNIISITAIAIGFLVTILFQLWSYKQKELFKFFIENQYDSLLKKYSISAVIYSIILLTLAIVLGIYFDSYLEPTNCIILSALFNICLILTLFSFIRITIIFFNVNKFIECEESFTIKQHPKNKYHFDKIDD